MAQLPIIATCALLMLSGLTGTHAAPSQAPAASEAARVTIDGVHLLGPFHLRATPVDPLLASPFVVPPCGDESESPAEMLFEGTATLDGATWHPRLAANTFTASASTTRLNPNDTTPWIKVSRRMCRSTMVTSDTWDVMPTTAA